MKKAFQKKERAEFFWFFALSLVFHVFAILFFIGSKNFIQLFFEKKPQKIAPMSIRVDTVALPDFQPKEEFEEETVEKPSFKPKIKKPENKLTQSKKQKLKKKPKAKKIIKKSKSKKQNQTKKTVERKGNQKSEGADKGQDLSKGQLLEIEMYNNIVRNQIHSYWNLPQHLMDSFLTAQIEIKINNKGELIEKQILISSGNDLFDSKVLKTVESSAPFSPPPASVQRLIEDGIVLNLTSRD